MRPLLAAFRIGFTHVFAYRTEVVIQLVSAAIVAGLNASLWTVAGRGRATIAGIPSVEMVSYVVIAWVSVSFVATRVNDEIGRRFRDGAIASDLVRPLGIQGFWYARDLGRALACLGLQTAPLLLLCLAVFDVQLPARPSTWLLWGLSLLLAHATNYGLSFLVGLAAAHLQDVSGLSHLKGTLVSVFSGALIPLELFGATLRPFVFALPFHAMVHSPASIFLERDIDVGGVLIEQAAWAFALWGVGAWAWRVATRHLIVAGG